MFGRVLGDVICLALGVARVCDVVGFMLWLANLVPDLVIGLACGAVLALVVVLGRALGLFLGFGLALGLEFGPLLISFACFWTQGASQICDLAFVTPSMLFHAWCGAEEATDLREYPW